MVSRDGRRIACLSTKAGGTSFWHDVDRAGKDETAVLGPEGSVRGAEFGYEGAMLPGYLGLADLSPDAREVVTSANGRVPVETARRSRPGAHTNGPPGFTASFHPEPGHVQLAMYGQGFLHAFSLRTGRENKALGTDLGPEADSSVPGRTGNFASVRTKGSMMELWSVGRTGKPPQRVLGPMGPLNPWEYREGSQDDSSVHFLANGNSVRFQDAADPEGRGESHVFAEEQKFLAVSRDGRTLLRTVGKNTVGILHLDPALWKKELCDILGRDLSGNERRGLPVWLPDRICPPGGR